MDIPSYVLGKKAGSGGGSNYQSKSVEITENGTTSITADTGYDALSNVNVTTNIQPDLESKTITITENTTTLIEPTQGKDGLSSVSVTTDVSGGGKYAPRRITFQSYNGTELDYEVQNLDVSNITNMNNMFYYCMQLTRLDLSTWNTSNVTTFYSFCEKCNNLRNITFGNNFNTSNVDTFTNMFGDCRALTSLDLSSFNTKKATSVMQMFTGCRNLTHIDFGDNFEFPLLQTNHQNMFLNCTKLDDDTLNSILHICTTMNVGTKRLNYIGIQDSTLVAKIPTLSNYQEFLDAGWTIS